MNIDPYILAFSFVTVAVTVWMGFRSAKSSKTASDFFVAGRSVGVGMNASAISGEYLSAASFMGIAGMVMSSGYDALWYPVCYACGYLFLLLFIAGPLRRFGAYTIPDFAEGRFDSPVFRKIAVVFVLFIGFFYTMPQMKGAGTTLAYIFPGLPYWAGVVLVGAVITLNVALGGMKGITLVQAFQYWAKMFAISVPIFVLMAVYGHYGKQVGANGGNFEPRTSNSELGTNAAAPFKVQGSEFKVQSSEIRQPLPAKAPADSTWLNPFGPLTTKAAKNAAKAIGEKAAKELSREGAKGAKENTSSTSPFANFAPSRETIPLRAGLAADQRMTVPLDSLTVTQALGVYAELTGRQLLPNTNSLATRADDFLGGQLSAWKLVQRPRTPDAGVREHGDGAFTAVEVKEAIEGQLRSNGWELVAAGHKGFLLKHLSQSAPRGNNPPLIGNQSPVIGNRSSVIKNQSSTGENHPSTTKNDPSDTENRSSDIENDPPKTDLVAAMGKKIEVLPSRQGLFGAVNAREGSPLLLAADAPATPPAATTVQAAPQSAVASSVAQAAEKAWLAKHEKPLALLYTYSLIIAIVCGTAGLPHILVRFYTNPDGVAAKRTTMWVMILIGVFYVFPPVFGVIGRNLLPDLYNGLGAKGTDKIVLELPRLLNEKYAPLGSILSGITCAGAFAAFMSTFSGLLVSMTGALAHDVYGRILRPKSTPEQRMRMFKIGAVLIGGVAIVLGSFVEPLEINFMVGQAFAIAAASYFPLLFMAVWWRKLTMKGAAVGMLAGGVCALVAAALTNFSNLALDKGPMGKLFSGFAPLNDFWAAHPLLRILCEQPAIWAVPLAIVLMIVVSKLTAQTVPSDSRMKMLVLHAPEQLGLKQEYIQEHQAGPGH